MNTSERCISVLPAQLLILLVLLLIFTPSCAAARLYVPVNQPVVSAGTDNWTTHFMHAGFRQQGSITCISQRCWMALSGSTPPVIMLQRVLDQPLDAQHQLSVYLGWPRDVQGQRSGVQNRSNDPARVRIIENKLGPTILWVASNCDQLCVTSIILEYHAFIHHGTTVIELIQIDRPTADWTRDPAGCLGPMFQAISARGIAYSGAIDQPGCTISAAGEGVRDRRGQDYEIVAADCLSIRFWQLALISCEREVLAAVEFRYQLRATLGAPAHQISPTIEELPTVALLFKADPDPWRRADFAGVICRLEPQLLPEAPASRARRWRRMHEPRGAVAPTLRPPRITRPRGI